MMSITAHHFCVMTDIELTPEERERYEIIRECIDRDITNKVASARLGLTVRQVQRLKCAVRKEGEAGILHGNRFGEAWNATSTTLKKSVVAFLKKKQHRDFGPTFAQEKLAKKGLVLGVETMRSIMIEHGLWRPRERTSREVHRKWRERRALRGELVQFDGSYHLWLEDRAEKGCLLAAIDDADNGVVAVFEDNEGVYAVFRFWLAYFLAYGLPVAIYLDKFSTYKINHKSAVDNEELMTQFKRAMKELGVEVINAHSPEAKGRIERLFKTLQDRLVKEMRLADISDRAAANTFLKETYLPAHNVQFKMPPRSAGDAHRSLTDELRKKLPAILSIQSVRSVNNDFTIRFKNTWLQLSATQETTVFKGDAVMIEERLDGTLLVRLRDTYLAYTALPARPDRIRTRVTALTREKPRVVPPPGHPWRKPFLTKKSRHAR
jgi:hypothetical protein